MSFRSAIAAIGICALVTVPFAAAAPSKLQTTFRSTLLADPATSPSIKQSLRSSAAVVDPRPLFGDLSGDGKADAVVALLSGGAAGSIAVYVLSTDGASAGKLRVVYRNQHLDQATIALGAGPSLVVGEPRYAAGDAVCCPAKIMRRVYTWATAKHAMRLRSSRLVATSPKPPAATKQPTTPPTNPTTTTTTTTTPTPTTTTPAPPTQGGGATAP